jgi:hypothetical protein
MTAWSALPLSLFSLSPSLPSSLSMYRQRDPLHENVKEERKRERHRNRERDGEVDITERRTGFEV